MPSAKALARARDKVRDLTGPQVYCVPIPALVGRGQPLDDELERYYRHGYPRSVFRQLNQNLYHRLNHHLRRRSQRPYRAVEGTDSLCQAATPRPAAIVIVLA